MVNFLGIKNILLEDKLFLVFWGDFLVFKIWF